MPSYVLSCCSTADVTREWLDDHDIKYLYFNYYLNGEMCKDDFGATNSPAELYAKMLAGAEAKTSQISAGDYMEHFERYLAQGLDVLHVTLSTGISGTFNSACAARDQLAEKYPDRKIYVIDSLAASAGFGLLMERLAGLRDAGMGIDELATWAEDHKHEVQHWFFSSDLTFFVRGGRISKAAGLVGGVLKICPVMDVEPDGSLAVKEKIRTKAKAINRVVGLLRQVLHQPVRVPRGRAGGGAPHRGDLPQARRQGGDLPHRRHHRRAHRTGHRGHVLLGPAEGLGTGHKRLGGGRRLGGRPFLVTRGAVAASLTIVGDFSGMPQVSATIRLKSRRSKNATSEEVLRGLAENHRQSARRYRGIEKNLS